MPPARPKSKQPPAEPIKPRAKGGVGPGKSYLGVVLDTEMFDQLKSRSVEENRSMSAQAAYYIKHGLGAPRPIPPGPA